MYDHGPIEYKLSLSSSKRWLVKRINRSDLQESNDYSEGMRRVKRMNFTEESSDEEPSTP